MPSKIPEIIMSIDNENGWGGVGGWGVGVCGGGGGGGGGEGGGGYHSVSAIFFIFDWLP